MQLVKLFLVAGFIVTCYISSFYFIHWSSQPVYYSRAERIGLGALGFIGLVSSTLLIGFVVHNLIPTN